MSPTVAIGPPITDTRPSPPSTIPDTFAIRAWRWFDDKSHKDGGEWRIMLYGSSSRTLEAAEKNARAAHHAPERNVQVVTIEGDDL